MEKTYVPLFSEILDKVHKAKTKDKKVAILREHKTDYIKMLLKILVDPKIEWVFPEVKFLIHQMKSNWNRTYCFGTRVKKNLEIY